MKSYYPIINYPKKYDEIIKSKPKTPTPPTEPKPPQKPIKPELKSSEGCLPTGFVLIILSISILFIFIAVSNQYEDILPKAIPLLIGCIVILFFNFSLNKDPKKEYPEKLRNYESDIKKYNIDIKYYEVKKEEYSKKLNLHKEVIKESQSINNITSHKSKLFRSFNQNICLPRKNENKTKKGVSEVFFFSYLSKYFSNIYINIVLEVDELKLYPDFTYISNDNKLYIDIEIDEPYIGSNGSPIHHIESNDTWRNDFFSNCGWSVIRFSEEQIITQPEKCCEFINIFINKYLNLEQINKEEIINKTKISTVYRWTKDEAHRLAFRRYRLSYLPIKLKAKIQEETFENTSNIEDEVIDNWKNRNEEYDNELPF